ncbi:Multicopper oxidase with three cupredoxin domains (includes cell division protein FtsP and spore coat protein CotA) [Micromonospora pallida]|uniref:Multicopper oxidase with three cupredoxin domains (Includes cell division protein FtsP and spore coat protein CotA) n=1 Tax=Micromonospora pallida TaxID=145854 RepID=A0A1C6TJU7_9ACTN|nr:multicopper oxidase family protein [Micromonospora pallida]SCL41833.1 Multicopper oxidase with three cupredoxin domains (includes cell division protein FtsP and spore coat protein CotA) [Micromonospora pallida]
MTTAQWILLDHGVALLGVATWFSTGVTAALRRYRLAFGLLVGALLVTVARLATVAALAGQGWWFAQEKALLGLPLLGAAGLAAALIAGPRLRTAGRTPGAGLPTGGLVALFTAGYAALAGLVVTFIAGSPLTWSTALIAVSFVCAGALLTSRVVTGPAAERTEDHTRAPAPPGRSMLSRRGFIGMAGGVVAAGAGLTGVGLLFRAPEAVVTGGGPRRAAGSGATVSVADLRGAREPAPGGTTRRHTLTARTATVRLPSGHDVDAWTYDGQLPGPAITATEGDLIELTLRNTDIEDGVTLHWHGYDVPCGEDGAPGATQDAVTPGGEFVYRFRADQVGTYWYHTHQTSHPGVRRGLYGTLVVTPRQAEPAELDLTLPVHTFDDAVVIGNQDGRTVHPARPGAPVRLRLVNTDSDPHRFALTGAAFRVVAVDGRDLNQPGEVRDVGLRLPAGGRYDVVLTMPDIPVALLLDNDRDRGVLLRPTEHTGDDPAPPDTSDWPELDLLHYGEPAAVPFDADHADRHFTVVLDRALTLVDGRPAYAQAVNGRGHPSIPDQLVAEGDLVRFTVVNRSLETHPWHLHGHPVLILSRDGTRSSGSPLWMDTFDVRPGEVWEVAFRADNPGIWINHCHNLVHQDQGMMLQLVYDRVRTPFADASHGHS